MTLQVQEDMPVSRRRASLIEDMRIVMKGMVDLRRMRGLHPSGKLMMTDTHDPIGLLVKSMMECSLERLHRIDCELYAHYGLAVEQKKHGSAGSEFRFDRMVGVWSMLFSVSSDSPISGTARDLVVTFFEDPLAYFELENLVWNGLNSRDLYSANLLLNSGYLVGKRPNDLSLNPMVERFFRRAKGQMVSQVWRPND